MKIPTDRKYEILGVLLISLTILLFLILVTDGYQGSVYRPMDGMGEAYNALGWPGAWVAGILCLLLGGAAHALYCLTAVWGGILLRHNPLDRLVTRLAGLLLVTFGVAALLHVNLNGFDNGGPAGGLIGSFFGGTAAKYFDWAGANVLGLTVTLVGLLLSTEFLLVRMFNRARVGSILVVNATAQATMVAIEWFKRIEPKDDYSDDYLDEELPPNEALPRDDDDRGEFDDLEPPASKRKSIRIWPRSLRIFRRDEKKEGDDELPFDAVPDIEDLEDNEPLFEVLAGAQEDPPEDEAEPPVLFAIASLDGSDEKYEAATVELLDPDPAIVPAPPEPKAPPMPRRKTAPTDELPPDYVYPKRYKKPSMDIFEQPPERTVQNLTEHLHRTSHLIEERLRTFGIEARVTDVSRGPTITRFELEPAPGIKVSRFLALADDLALALKAHRVRVVAPIPGKDRVGIEVPNQVREPVVIRELLESPGFRQNEDKLCLAIGKDISGEVIMADLASMPHCLVAGATGAGKTVCVKTLLASLLFSKTPEELQLVLIDPKMVELSIFNDIPHLITPVVTDPKKASTALTWLLSEMNERYKLFAHLRVRDIEGYNESVDNGEIEMADQTGAVSESVESIRKLPYIVCVIDELADLMMLARAEVEDAIGRLAQLARAVGIHLLIATQRPSVDVLTGVIKANFPTRISFQVASRVDSRCILDEIGAERLIGQGDMLYLPAGRSRAIRIQGAFVSGDEMETLIAYLKTQAPPQYRDEIENFGKANDSINDFGDEEDEMLDDAIRVVLETGQASISMVQRRLRVGYTRAARLIDMMEMRGVVGPHIGSKAREILVDVPRTDEVA